MHSNSSSHHSLSHDDQGRTRKRERKQNRFKDGSYFQNSDSSSKDGNKNGTHPIEEDKHHHVSYKRRRVVQDDSDLNDGYLSDDGTSNHTPVPESTNLVDPDGDIVNKSTSGNTEKRLKVKIRKIDQEEVGLV